MAALGVLRAWATSERRPPRVTGAGRLGGRGGRALRAQPLRQLGLRRHARPGGCRGPARRRRAARSPRSSPRTGWSSTGPASAHGGARARRVPRAAHRAGAADGGRGPARRLRSPAAPGSSGCASRFRGQAAHAGTTPMAARRDAGLAAAEAALAIEAIPEAEGGVATTGELRLEPGIPSRDRRARGAGGRSPPPRARAAGADARATARERARGRRPAWLRGSPRPRCCGSSRSRSTPAWSPRAPPAPRSPGSPRASPAGRSTTPPRSPACCRRRWCSRRRATGSATRARRTPPERTSRSAIEAFAELAARLLDAELQPRMSRGLFALAFEETHIRPTHSLVFRSPNPLSRRRGSGGPNGMLNPGANRPRPEP